MIEPTADAGVLALTATKAKRARPADDAPPFAALLAAEPDAEPKAAAESDLPLADTPAPEAPMPEALAAAILAPLAPSPPDLPAATPLPAARQPDAVAGMTATIPPDCGEPPAPPAPVVNTPPATDAEATSTAAGESPSALPAPTTDTAVRAQTPPATVTPSAQRPAPGGQTLPPPTLSVARPEPADAAPAPAAVPTAIQALSRRPAKVAVESAAVAIPVDSASASRAAAVAPPVSAETAGPNVPFSFDSGGRFASPDDGSTETTAAPPADPAEPTADDGFSLETPVADIAIRQRAERGLDVLLRAADSRTADHLTDHLPQLEAQLQAIGAEVDGVRVEPRPAPMATAWGAGGNSASAQGSEQSGGWPASAEGRAPRRDAASPEGKPAASGSASGSNATGKVDRYA